MRVLANGVPLNQRTRRRIVVASAVKTCLERRLAQPDTPRSPQAAVARGLREGPFHTATCAIHILEFGRLLARPRRLQHRVALGWEAYGHASPSRLRRRAALAEQARLTGWPSKPDLHDRFAFGVLAAMPGDTFDSLPLHPMRLSTYKGLFQKGFSAHRFIASAPSPGQNQRVTAPDRSQGCSRRTARAMRPAPLDQATRKPLRLIPVPTRPGPPRTHRPR